MSDDPINALVSALLAEADVLALDGKIRFRLDAGFMLRDDRFCEAPRGR